MEAFRLSRNLEHVGAPETTAMHVTMRPKWEVQKVQAPKSDR